MARALSSEASELARRLSDRISLDEPIGARTTYRVGGSAALYLAVEELEDLEALTEANADLEVPVLIFGAGSNLLIADEGFSGICVAPGEGLGELVLDVPARRVTAGAGVAYPQLARRLSAAGLSGMEWAVGIPGSVGGAVRMNAGGHGSSTAERLVVAELYRTSDGTLRSASPLGLDLSYRHSNVEPDEMVLEATFTLDTDEQGSGEARLAEIVAWRREHQPGGRNAGSVFANPTEDSAGRLIDAAGLKGHRVGSAVVSDKHANFFLADKDGSANDVHALILEVRALVAERLGVELAVELKMIGFEP